MEKKIFGILLCILAVISLNAAEQKPVKINRVVTQHPESGLDFSISTIDKYLNSTIAITKTCRKNGSYAGFITYDKDPHLAKCIKTNKELLHATVQLLFIEEKFRRQGIGTTLLWHVIDEMKKMNVKVVTLQTQIANKNAQKMYENMGFELQKNHELASKICTYKLHLLDFSK